MKKYWILLLVGTFFIQGKDVHASLITVKPTGEVVWNVLGETTDGDIITEKPALNINSSNIAQNVNPREIVLSKSNGNINIEVDNVEQMFNADILKEDLVEIEERPKVRKITVSYEGDKFAIKQPGAIAVTNYPVVVRTKEGILMVRTQTGERNIYIMPLAAVQSLIRSKAIDQYDRENSFVLEEAKEGQLTYKINGQRVINLFNIYQYKVPVSGVVSAITGEVVSVEQPSWLKVFNFLFT